VIKICIRVRVYVCMHEFARVCACVRVCVCMRICMYTCFHLYLYTGLAVCYICMRSCSYIRMHMCLHMYNETEGSEECLL